MLPSVLIVGFKKSGSSSLRDAFSGDNRFAVIPAEGKSLYGKSASGEKGVNYIVEKNVEYINDFTFDSIVSKYTNASLPNPLIFIIVRNPLSRITSEYYHERRLLKNNKKPAKIISSTKEVREIIENSMYYEKINRFVGGDYSCVGNYIHILVLEDRQLNERLNHILKEYFAEEFNIRMGITNRGFELRSSRLELLRCVLIRYKLMRPVVFIIDKVNRKKNLRNIEISAAVQDIILRDKKNLEKLLGIKNIW